MLVEEAISPHGVMEGSGAYNRNSSLPARGAAWASPVLEKALQKIALDPQDRPVVVADYGSSQGKNSLSPMKIVIRGLQARIEPDRPIFVFHVDQASNDFNCLFEVLSKDPDRYAIAAENVFPCAIGRSFYEQVLPADSVHFGWSSYAAVWLRQIPCRIPGHIFPLASSGEVRAAFVRQAAEDWREFLALRARELRRGARLVIVLPGVPADGPLGFAKLVDYANLALNEMVQPGEIRSEERARMALGSYPRHKGELLAPFAANGQFCGLTVEACEESSLRDPAWSEYDLDGNKEKLATKQALFFRAVFMPTLASALEAPKAEDGEAARVFMDRLQNRLISHLMREPISADTLVQVMVLAKTE